MRIFRTQGSKSTTKAVPSTESLCVFLAFPLNIHLILLFSRAADILYFRESAGLGVSDGLWSLIIFLQNLDYPSISIFYWDELTKCNVVQKSPSNVQWLGESGWFNFSANVFINKNVIRNQIVLMILLYKDKWRVFTQCFVKFFWLFWLLQKTKYPILLFFSLRCIYLHPFYEQNTFT